MGDPVRSWQVDAQQCCRRGTGDRGDSRMWADLRTALPLGSGAGTVLAQACVWISRAGHGSSDSMGWMASSRLHAARIASIALDVLLYYHWIFLGVAWPRQGDDIGVASRRCRFDRGSLFMDAVYGRVHLGVRWMRSGSVIAKAGGSFAAGCVNGDHCDLSTVADFWNIDGFRCGRLAPHERERKTCPVAGVPFGQ